MVLQRLGFALVVLAIGQLSCGGDSPEPSSLPAAASGKALINAAQGGSVTAGPLTLEIPPGALDKDTTIAITQVGSTDATIFDLQPSGTTFKVPAIAHYRVPASVRASLPPNRGIGAIVGLANETGPFEYHAAALEPGGELQFRAPVPHFTTFHVHLAGVDYGVERLTPASVDAAVGETFGIAATVTRTGDAAEFRYYSDTLAVRTVTGTVLGFDVVGIRGWATDPNVTELLERVAVVPKESLPATGASTVKGATVTCKAAGNSTVTVMIEIEAEGKAVIPGYRLRRGGTDIEPTYRLIAEGGQTTVTDVIPFFAWIPDVKVTCAGASVSSGLGILSAQRDEFAFKAARPAPSFPLSSGTKSVTPSLGTAINAALDPLLTVGPGAAARLSTQFPCGDGPGGKTVCGTPGPFAAGDYIMLLSDFDAAIPLADPTWRYQHAFVFDADGIAANNYAPPAQYPKDFFAGTDKWFQLFYEPGKGWSTKVVDVRISNTNPVPSAVRFVIAGRELGIFIPRAELGAAPTFRATTFRHQGDYGLSGGPVDLSYFPLLGQPLLPVAVGKAIVLPE